VVNASVSATLAALGLTAAAASASASATAAGQGAALSLVASTGSASGPEAPVVGGHATDAPWRWVPFNPTHRPRARRRRAQDILFLGR
jgi:hypothetical protein